MSSDEGSKKDKKENEKDEAEAEPKAEADPIKELEEQRKEYEELKERMLRIAAEFDNYKKRVKRDIDEAESVGKAALIRDMLPVIDEFELAILAINGSKDSNVIIKGVEMLYSNLMDRLEREGLRAMDVGKVFDPYKHEIMMVRETDKEDGTIIEVVKKGYMFNNKLLRPASVIVSKSRSEDSAQKGK